MSVAAYVLDNFESLLAALLTAGSVIQARLGPESDWVEATRGNLFRAANPIMSRLGRPTVREKGAADYICTADLGEESFEEVVSPPYKRNLLATKKCRVVDGTKQWTRGSWAYKEDPTAPKQHHVYFFANLDGTVDVYGHREDNVVDPQGHLHDEQVHGDPNRRVRDLLDDAGVEWGVRERPHESLPQ